MSVIGQKRILHKNAFPYQNSYTEEDSFVCVTIVEEKEVPGDYTDDIHTGWRAEDNEGNSYYVNWEYFGETSSTPTWMWTDKYNCIWYDICQGIYERLPVKPRIVDMFSDVLEWCEIHHYMDYKDKTTTQLMLKIIQEKGETPPEHIMHCCFCNYEPYTKIPKDTWKGWF